MSILDLGAKECTQCGDVKALTEFNRDRRRPDGRKGWCRACQSDYEIDRYAGIRRRDLVNRQAQGIFLCLCVVARPNPKRCAACRWPVVAAMHPDVQARAVAKHPWFAEQIVNTEPMAAAS